MGKKGDALRAAKLETTKYTFTKAQLEAHDVQVRQAFVDQCRKDIDEHIKTEMDKHNAEVDQFIEEEWERRKKIFEGIDSGGEGFYNVLGLLLATSCRVLIEKFHWKPIPKDGYYDKRLAVVRFGDYLIDEINAIGTDENKDIRRYCDEVYDLYGVKFIREEETDG